MAGEQLLTPKVEPLAADFLEGEAREKVRRRLQVFLRGEIERRLAPLFAARALPLGGVGRGLVFQLIDAQGCLPAAEIGRQLAALDPPDRTALGRLGVRFGTESIYLEPLLRPDAMRFRALLWAVRQGRPPPALPSARRLAKPIEIDPALPPSFYAAIGLHVLEGVALRPDRLERLAALARRLARSGPFVAGPELSAVAGVEPPLLSRVLAGLGYRMVVGGGRETYIARSRRRTDSKGIRRREPKGEGHPFAKLRELKLA
jgi:ATP-dependent RNA helicase SUPV3L1/SUV3